MISKKRSSPKFKRFLWPKSEIYGFFRPKTGDFQKKRSSPETEVVIRRKLGVDHTVNHNGGFAYKLA